MTSDAPRGKGEAMLEAQLVIKLLWRKDIGGGFGENYSGVTSESGFKCFTDVIKLSMCIFSVFENI